LNVLIACQRYGPSKPSSLPSTEGGFTPTTLMAVLREKLGTDLWIGQLSCCGLGREPFFSGAVALSIFVDDFIKVCYMCYPREICMVEGHMWTERGMGVACWSDFPCRVYINSNCHDSQI
jgi:hypothetical protein